MRERLTPEEQAMIDRALASAQSGGTSTSLTVDRDWLTAEGNQDAFFLHYFPRDFLRWEPINRILLDFLEHESAGVALLPAQHGKSTTLKHWMIYVMCLEPQISFIYIEKTLPIARQAAQAISGILEANEGLRHDFGDFKGEPWGNEFFTIRQRPHHSQWPTCSFFGAGGQGGLGRRCNILIVDDPVTPDSAHSELERARDLMWWNEAASTCPSYLPLENHERYIRKTFLVGTTFHMDDLFQAVLKMGGMKLLHLKAVDERTGNCLAPTRFCYRDTEELRNSAYDNPADAELLKRIEDGKVTNLLDFRRMKGTAAFNRRYQNIPMDPDTQRFPELWFKGGDGFMAPPGGYPGCFDETLTLGSERVAGWRYVTGIDPAGGVKGKNTVNFACSTLGFNPEEPEKTYLADFHFGQYPLESDNPGRTTQTAIILDHAKRYNSRLILETNNVQSVWAGVLKRAAKEQGQLLQITGQHTSKSKRTDFDSGVDAMTAMVENGYFRIPYKEPSDKRKVQAMVDEFVYLGLHATDDVLMSIWLAWVVMERWRTRNKVEAVHLRERKPWMRQSDKWVLPDHWTEDQRRAFFGLDRREEIEEEVAL